MSSQKVMICIKEVVNGVTIMAILSNTRNQIRDFVI
jgi:hypothetical protein